MMLEHVHHELVPKLMRKRQGNCFLFKDNGDDAGDNVVGVAHDLEQPI